MFIYFKRVEKQKVKTMSNYIECALEFLFIKIQLLGLIYNTNHYKNLTENNHIQSTSLIKVGCWELKNCFTLTILKAFCKHEKNAPY